MEGITASNDNFTPDEEREMDRAAMEKECIELEGKIEMAKREVIRLESILEQRRNALETFPQKAS